MFRLISMTIRLTALAGLLLSMQYAVVKRHAASDGTAADKTPTAATPAENGGLLGLIGKQAFDFNGTDWAEMVSKLTSSASDSNLAPAKNAKKQLKPPRSGNVTLIRYNSPDEKQGTPAGVTTERLPLDGNAMMVNGRLQIYRPSHQPQKMP